MRFASILIYILSFVYSTTTVFVSGYDIENGYLEIKIINEEPIVGFQFLISTSSELEAEFGTEILNMEGQTITLTGYDFEDQVVFTDNVSAVESNFSIFGDENGFIIGFSLTTGSLEDIPETDDFENGQVLVRIPWTFNELNGGTIGIDNPKFITPGTSGGPPLYVETIVGENYYIEPLSIDKIDLPKSFELGEAFPNPFNPETVIKYSVPTQSFVKLNVYDINGRQIKSLVNTMTMPGRYSTLWNGVDDFGNEVSSGLYIYQLISGNTVLSEKIMLIK